ncbi:trehalase-like domain-containing protein [Kribbella capetownensis]|uniref:trehalase-like domain-containing protein n=1 Tax=Kribbella capetownensis TaxID=1572659 RepID=UPI001EDCE4E9|nr:trehalase-like domain-containing protein [Kribbella capetownensis]
MTTIEDYALLGDLHTAALLDTAEAGRWLLAPGAGGPCARRRYRGDTLVLESEWDTPEGTVRIIDFMPPRGQAPDIVRIVQGVSGAVPMVGELRLRFDYGQIIPWVRNVGGAIEAVAGPDSAWLRTPAPLEGRDNRTISEFTVRAGDTVPFVLTWAPSHLSRPKPVDADRALADTLDFWERCSERSTVTGRWRDDLQRSLIVLKALTYRPTGGIVAAATTKKTPTTGCGRCADHGATSRTPK